MENLKKKIIYFSPKTKNISKNSNLILLYSLFSQEELR